MSKVYTFSPAGVALIKEFEGLRLRAYQDQAGVWTVGYGTTRLYGRKVVSTDVVTEAEAEESLRRDVAPICTSLATLVKRTLAQHEVDALVCFCYNVGMGAFTTSSLRKTLNANGVIDETLFTRWNKIRIDGELQPSPGLTRRRRAEYQLFSQGT